MKKIISWNLGQRNISYWLSMSLLLMVIINVASWIDLSRMARTIIRNYIIDSYGIILPSWRYYGMLEFLFTQLLFNMLFNVMIAIFNYFISMLPNVKKPDKRLLFRFIFKSVFIADLIFGSVLEILAIKGIIQIKDKFPSNSITTWIYFIFFLIGSILYWKNIFPIKQYYKLKCLLENDKAYEDNVWYCISNSQYRLSTFDRVLRKGKITEPIVDSQDLMLINAHKSIELKKESFVFYLIIIEQKEGISKVFEKQIESVINIPHSKVLILYLQARNEDDDKLNWIRGLKHNVNVHIKNLYIQERVANLDIEQIVSEIRMKRQMNVRTPLRFIANKQLIQTYFNISKGPQICLDFLKTILNTLEILPAIYALFDFIDLQYRMTIACAKVPDYNWMWKKRMVIGKIMDMANIIEESVIKINFDNGRISISTEEIFSKIISKDEYVLIKKYLPNYQIKEELCAYHTIIYLTTSLRNVLRGHGTFDSKDANKLFELVFKLAIMNAHILAIEDIYIKVDNTKVWDEYCYLKVIGKIKGKEECLSPFLVALPNESILVFNNCHIANVQSKKKVVEYINYLDGTVILPEFLSVNIDKMTR